MSDQTTRGSCHQSPGAWIVIALWAMTGCQAVEGPFARWRMARDKELAQGVSAEEIGDKRGLMARWLSPKPGPPTDATPKSTLVLGSDGWTAPKPLADPVAEKELQAAEALFQQGKLPEAEKAYAQIAKKRKETNWGEKAQYSLAEIQYQRGNLVAANDSFGELMKTYTNTRYLEKGVAREYAIAQAWLAAAEGTKSSDLRPDKDQRSAAKPVATSSWTDRFTGKLPFVDTTGHALQGLEHVRHHDPSGPLADDAVLRIADYHYAHGNYEDASIHYDQLLSDHPKSPFVRRAMLSSIDSKIKNYVGPEYDGSGLEKAKEMINQYLSTYPERQAGQNDSLYHARDVITDQEAERAYKIGEHYLWTGKITSAEYSFGEVPVKWPTSTWAKKAKIQLAQIAKMPRQATLPSRIMTQPGSTDPLTGGTGAGMGMGGMSGAPGGMGANGMNGYGP